MENSKSMLKRKLNTNFLATDLAERTSYAKSAQRNICPMCGGQLVQVEIERDEFSTYAAAMSRQECIRCGNAFTRRMMWPKRKRRQ